MSEKDTTKVLAIIASMPHANFAVFKIKLLTATMLQQIQESKTTLLPDVYKSTRANIN